ncbi:MAG: hypothetical protein HFH43_14275 [Lachnospiraceae bacterium]|nr:hypothetical protein [Lachnospiraceae bacterium]
MASREELLAGIRPGMRLTEGFIRSIYSNEISCPGFSEQAISALEQAGCSRARQYYENWVAEYEAAYKAEIKPVAHWYRLECEKQWGKRQKEGEERRKTQEEVELLKQKKRLLIQKLQILTGN